MRVAVLDRFYCIRIHYECKGWDRKFVLMITVLHHTTVNPDFPVMIDLISHIPSNFTFGDVLYTIWTSLS